MSVFSRGLDWFKEQFSERPDEEYEMESDDEGYTPEEQPRRLGALPARAVRPMDAVIMVPRTYGDARRAVDAIEKGLVVLVVLGDNVDDDTATRFVDFMSGAIYFGKGEVTLVNEHVLICAPSAVHLETDSLPSLTGIPVWKGPGV